MEYDDREKIEIYVSCRQLPSKSAQNDIQVKCHLLEQGNWRLIGETEVSEDNAEPNFATPFTVDFIFESQQPILFEIFNVHNRSSVQLLGTVQTTVGSIMGARRQTSSYDLKLKDAKASGQLITQGEKFGGGGEIVSWQWKGIGLINTDGTTGKSDPFLRFFKVRKGGDVIKVHETEPIKDNLDPIWKPFGISQDKLCYSSKSTIKVECWDWEKAGQYQFIGECETTLDSLRGGATQLQLRHPKVQGPTGTLQVAFQSTEVKSSGQDSFIDYLRGGTQLNAVVAIDFTGSNGDAQYSYSLHYMNPKGDLNEYQKAITSVCQIVLNYDFDQLIPVYGFGGKPHYPTLDSKAVSHCFPCTGSPEQHEVQGLQGIMDVYSYGLKHVELAGPTYFAPLLHESLKVAELHKQRDDDVYTILLILTDGEIHDMDESIEAIIRASELPLSIIIVGVGKADFTKMVILDGDKGLTDSQGRKASRDVVQFVPFNNFNGDMNQLAQHVLAEIPDQVVQYMKMIGKKPKPPQTF